MTFAAVYRAGSETSPNFGKIRNHDIPVIKGVVKPKMGGISVFSKRDANWHENRTWVLPQSSASSGVTLSLPSELKVSILQGDQWVIEPAHEMPLDSFQEALESLDKSAVRYDSASFPIENKDHSKSFSTPNLPEISSNPSKHVRFVYMALLAIARERILIDEWDDNDYTDIAYMAKHLDTTSGDTGLSALEYQSGKILTKQQALAALAVVAYIKQQDAECQKANDEDKEADWFNDRALLRIALSLDNLKDHPILGEKVRGLYM